MIRMTNLDKPDGTVQRDLKLKQIVQILLQVLAVGNLWPTGQKAGDMKLHQPHTEAASLEKGRSDARSAYHDCFPPIPAFIV